jgi:hypothetical protein
MAHSWIIRFLEHRIADKRILRLVAKWLKVGTVEDGRVTRGKRGAPHSERCEKPQYFGCGYTA